MRTLGRGLVDSWTRNVDWTGPMNGIGCLGRIEEMEIDERWNGIGGARLDRWLSSDQDRGMELGYDTV